LRNHPRVLKNVFDNCRIGFEWRQLSFELVYFLLWMKVFFLFEKNFVRINCTFIIGWNTHLRVFSLLKVSLQNKRFLHLFFLKHLLLKCLFSLSNGKRCCIFSIFIRPTFMLQKMFAEATSVIEEFIAVWVNTEIFFSLFLRSLNYKY